MVLVPVGLFAEQRVDVGVRGIIALAGGPKLLEEVLPRADDIIILASERVAKEVQAVLSLIHRISSNENDSLHLLEPS